MREQIAAQIGRIQAAAQSVAAADVLCALAKAALQNHYVMPEVDDSDRIEIREGRHPVVERVLEDTLFVPNDTLLNCTSDRVYVITGPNMAGKSTFCITFSIFPLSLVISGSSTFFLLLANASEAFVRSRQAAKIMYKTFCLMRYFFCFC